MRMLLLGVIAFSVAAFAKPRKVVKHKFQINVPQGWDVAHKDEEADPIKLALTSKDKTANVTVMVVSIANFESAASILSATDARRTAAKATSYEKAKITKELLGKIGADDGVIGRYVQEEVLQKVIVVTKDSRAYVVIGAFRKTKAQELSRGVEASLQSFRLTT